MSDTAPYYLILALASVPALADNRRLGLGWLYFFLLLLMFVGLRHQVGSDWGGYLQIADEMGKTPFVELFRIQEFFYYFIVWMSVELGLGIYGANLVTTFIFLYGLFRFCAKQQNPWLSLAVGLPFLVIVIGMSANRQAAAIGVTLLLLAVWRESGLLRKLFLIVAAALFHTSAVVFILLFVVDGRMTLIRKMVISSIVFAVAIYFLRDSFIVNRYGSSYIEGRDVFQAAGALQQILLNALPGLLILIFARSLKQKLPDFGFLLGMALVSVALVPLAFALSVAASRLSFYLFPVAIVGLPALANLFSEKTSKLIARYLVVLFCLATLAAWLTFANHAYNHKPYGNVLFL